MFYNIVHRSSRLFPLLILGMLLMSVLPWNDAQALTLINKTKLQNEDGTTKAQQFATDSGFATDDASTVNSIIGTVINVVLSLIGTAFLILIIYGGIVLFQARGEESEVKKAQKIIEQGVIGLVIVLGAFAISEFILGRFLSQLLTQDAL